MSGSSLGFEKSSRAAFILRERGGLLRQQLYFFTVFLIIETKSVCFFSGWRVKSSARRAEKRIKRERNNL